MSETGNVFWYRIVFQGTLKITVLDEMPLYKALATTIPSQKALGPCKPT